MTGHLRGSILDEQPESILDANQQLRLFGEVFHVRQAFKVCILRPELSAVQLGRGVDQAVGHGQTVASGIQCDTQVQINDLALLHVGGSLGSKLFTFRSAQIFIDFIDRDDRYDQGLDLGDLFLKSFASLVAIKDFKPTRDQNPSRRFRIIESP